MTAPLHDWVGNATIAEMQQFARDVRRHAPEDRSSRPQIDRFRYRRYLTLGWIREMDHPPYYELTSNGESVYWRHLERSDDW